MSFLKFDSVRFLPKVTKFLRILSSRKIIYRTIYITHKILGRLENQKINDNKCNDKMNFQASRTTSQTDSGLAQCVTVRACMRSGAELFMLPPKKIESDAP